MGNITISPNDDFELRSPITITIRVDKPLNAYGKMLTNCKIEESDSIGKLNDIRKGFNKFIQLKG